MASPNTLTLGNIAIYQESINNLNKIMKDSGLDFSELANIAQISLDYLKDKDITQNQVWRDLDDKLNRMFPLEESEVLKQKAWNPFHTTWTMYFSLLVGGKSVVCYCKKGEAGDEIFFISADFVSGIIPENFFLFKEAVVFQAFCPPLIPQLTGDKLLISGEGSAGYLWSPVTGEHELLGGIDPVA